MYYCSDCQCEFSNPKIIYESHNLSSPPFEKNFVCPACNSPSIREKTVTHCRCCGAKLKPADIEYCSDACKRKGEILWRMQIKKRQLAETSPLGIIINNIEDYNRKNNKKYSYGQYVALVEHREKNKKCTKKKRNT